MRESGGSIPYGRYSATTLTILFIEIKPPNCIVTRISRGLFNKYFSSNRNKTKYLNNRISCLLYFI